MSRWTMTLAMASGAMMMACGEISADPLEPSGNPGGDVDVPESPADPGNGPDVPGATSQDRSLSQADKEALGVVLSEVEGLGEWMNGMEVDEVGTVTVSFNGGNPAPTTTGTTAAVGVTVMDGFVQQFSDTVGTDVYEGTLVIAWDGLDAKAQTVDEMLVILAADIVDPGTVDVGSLFVMDPSQKTLDIDALVLYSDYAAGKLYVGNDGSFTIDSVTLDPAVPCATPPVGATSCTEADGDLEGSLEIDADGYDGSLIVIGPGVPGAGQNGPGSGEVEAVEITAEFDLPVTRFVTVQ